MISQCSSGRASESVGLKGAEPDEQGQNDTEQDQGTGAACAHERGNEWRAKNPPEQPPGSDEAVESLRLIRAGDLVEKRPEGRNPDRTPEIAEQIKCIVENCRRLIADQDAENRKGDKKDCNQTGDQTPSAQTVIQKREGNHGAERHIDVHTFGDQFMFGSEVSYEQTLLERLQYLKRRCHGEEE